ncbi:hypothetical protein EUCA11A_17100 [Eubacterium callanderi]|uniref:hypothetical protein n=1 Tax=Eubacterium callanderi TaxID=53442 RepID=UPI0029FEECBA|nr:hypothetical protein [Eubacterium callanderi]WPK67547.1 hypothetical protein EUCA2A_17100 [Eubacterium callanderi]WPK71845.1 hypothetical protein EUCA11A_17100 [Eubacterium callanderi]
MSSLKKEIKNIIQSGKNIGNAYKETGIAVGESYAKAGIKAAEIFKNLHDSESEEVEVKHPTKK